ncbi:MAG: VWA domain-containing protein [Gammaproteobacteria bacterium]|nr:VWA domain-containing protein [Gammaproteobacteria bacterium]MDH5728370.1 VWA domain-containing protein [Gammaproteobacteria bacterium]
MKKLILLFILITIFGLSACTETAPKTRAVYMLLDTSGTYTEELKKAQTIINYLLGNLANGDSLAVARIDSGSFSEKDILHKVTFDSRPSRANEQKRAFKRKVDEFVASVKSASHTDISGGLLQATEFLNETGASEKFVLIFSDMEEDLKKGHVRDFSIPLVGIKVVALNVTKLRMDIVDPREYLNRLDMWEKKVLDGGGKWTVLNDLERLENLLKV